MTSDRDTDFTVAILLTYPANKPIDFIVLGVFVKCSVPRTHWKSIQIFTSFNQTDVGCENGLTRSCLVLVLFPAPLAKKCSPERQTWTVTSGRTLASSLTDVRTVSAVLASPRTCSVTSEIYTNAGSEYLPATIIHDLLHLSYLTLLDIFFFFSIYYWWSPCSVYIW